LDDTGVVRVGVFSNGSWYLDMKGDGVWDGGVVDKVIPISVRVCLMQYLLQVTGTVLEQQRSASSPTVVGIWT